jgi:hypothetical protein
VFVSNLMELLFMESARGWVEADFLLKLVIYPVIVNPRFSHLSNKNEDNYQRLHYRFHNIIDKGSK